jgi:magnesium chelatase subunit I
MTSEIPQPQEETPTAEAGLPPVNSLRELIDRISGRGFQAAQATSDSGVADTLPFPFLAMVGQREMKLALILALINPAVGGVLLVGPRGTGKTTAVRGLTDLLPEVPRSLCYYGCMPEDIEAGGIDAVCPDCARKYAQGDPLFQLDRVRMVELPLNSRIEEVVGGIDERAAVHSRLQLRRGLLSQADRNILYVDEINLLDNDIVDAILDAAAQGSYTVRRGAISATYRARFVLIGSMNPEEGSLRPQILDRFGLRILVHGLEDREQRLEAYRRVRSYLTNPRRTVATYLAETAQLQAEIQAARDLLPQVELPDSVAESGLALIDELHIDSLRAEITLFEAARAYAAADGRNTVTAQDLFGVAPMTLRVRRSTFITEFFAAQQVEENEIRKILDASVSTDEEE